MSNPLISIHISNSFHKRVSYTNPLQSWLD